MSQAGAVLLTQTVAAVGLDVTLPAAMPGTNSSHTPLLPSARMGCAQPLQQPEAERR